MQRSHAVTLDSPDQSVLVQAEPKGPRPLDPTLHARLLAQRREIYSEVDKQYPLFLESVHGLMAEQAGRPEFPFVVRRIWMDSAGEMPLGWECGFRECYESFVRRFTWTPHSCSRLNDRLLKRTLSVWQARTVIPLSVNAASSMIMEVERLVDAGVEL